MSELEFLKIISPFKDRVFRLSKRLLISEDEARDASQEIFIKLWQLKKNYTSIITSRHSLLQ